MSSTRAETVNTCSIVYCAVVLLSIFQKSVEIELVLLRCLCVFITVAHLHFGICLVMFYILLLLQSMSVLIFT